MSCTPRLRPSVGEAEAVFVGECVEPGVEPLVEGGVVVGAEAVGLVVFVLVPKPHHRIKTKDTRKYTFTKKEV